MVKQEDQCGNCRFWQLREVAGEARSVGQCRFNPPIYVHREGVGGVRLGTSPFTLAAGWCGKHEPDAQQQSASIRSYRIEREAARLLSAAREVAAREAEAQEGSAFNYRVRLGQLSEEISQAVPQLDAAIRALANDQAKCDAAVIELLGWASLDTGIAEAVRAGTEN